MSKAEPAPDPGPVFAALADPTRRALLLRLADGRRRSIATLALGTGLTRQGIAKHLRILADAGLVDEQRAGREAQFACRPDPLADARDWLDGLEREWASALGRLRDLVDTDGRH